MTGGPGPLVCCSGGVGLVAGLLPGDVRVSAWRSARCGAPWSSLSSTPLVVGLPASVRPAHLRARLGPYIQCGCGRGDVGIGADS